MVSPGDRYKHKQIKDVIYEVTAVDVVKKRVFLQDIAAPGIIPVTYAQLSKSYRRIK
jgi:hypothetical protein